MSEKQLAVISKKQVEDLDSVAKEYAIAIKDDSPFGSSLTLAKGITKLRELLTPEIMKPIMAMMNTDLGFRTDKDPKLTDRNTGKPYVPYSEEIVKEAVIEATLRGFYVANNEFNIIAGKFYAAKNGLRRRVTSYAGLTDFKDNYEIPRMAGEKGAIVKARATWKKDGISDSVEREIPVKVNSMMGADAILGKAERKLLNTVYHRLSGINTPEGEVTDSDLEQAKTVPNIKFGEQKPVDVTPEPKTIEPKELLFVRIDEWEVSRLAFENHLKKLNVLSTAETLDSISQEKAQAILDKIAEYIQGMKK